jgi:hypothetical protein
MAVEDSKRSSGLVCCGSETIPLSKCRMIRYNFAVQPFNPSWFNDGPLSWNAALEEALRRKKQGNVAPVTGTD